MWSDDIRRRTILVLMLVFLGGGGAILAGRWLWDGGKDGEREWMPVGSQVEALLNSEAPTAETGHAGNPQASVDKQEASPTPKAPKEQTGLAESDRPFMESAAGMEKPNPTPVGNNNGLIDINTAGAARLMDLPGIGASKAKAIVEYREMNGGFRLPSDIMKVKGIGPKIFESLRERITVSP